MARCTHCNMVLTEKEVAGDCCPVCGKALPTGRNDPASLHTQRTTIQSIHESVIDSKGFLTTRLAFKSVPILSAWSVDGPIGGQIVTTQYDMANVRNHVLEASWLKLAFCWRYLWKAALAWLLSLVALLHPANCDPLGNPVIFFGGGLVSFCVCWWVSYALAFEVALEDHARRERGLGPDAKLKTVDERHWPSFLKRLKTIDSSV